MMPYGPSSIAKRRVKIVAAARPAADQRLPIRVRENVIEIEMQLSDHAHTTAVLIVDGKGRQPSCHSEAENHRVSVAAPSASFILWTRSPDPKH